MASRFNGILETNTNKILKKYSPCIVDREVFVMGMIGLTGYGAFALTNSLYKLKKFNREYNEKNKK